jgi:uncharacterized protein (TIGR03118 family)
MYFPRLSKCLTVLLLTPVLPAATGYLVHNLVADVAGVADFTDPNLVNAWGISITATSPFWLCDGGTGLSTVYTSSATAFSISATKVVIPPSASGGNKVCTGIVANSVTTAFLVGATNPRNASFIFATEGGTISGWANAVDPLNAQIAVDNSAAGAVYKGLAIVNTGTTSGTPQLYAANFNSGAIDVFGQDWKPVKLDAGAFTDPAVPAGFAPFNIQNLGGKLYVTYAKQDPNKKFDVPAVGNGHVSIYDVNGKLLQHLISGGQLNSPWGVQIAPANTFGKFSGDLLVGNFGDGLINAYNPTTGALVGTLQDQNGNNIRISGLWGLQFGNGGSGGDVNSLFFTAGPSAQQHGLFGVIEANPLTSAAAIVNNNAVTAGIAPNTWVMIMGSGLSATTRLWKASDFTGTNLPISMDGVSVMIGGKPAYVEFVSPKQVNVLTPTDLPIGSTVPVVISDNGLTSDTINIQTQNLAPSVFVQGGKYAIAQHANNTLAGPTSITGATPVKSGETIVIYAIGLGATTPAIPNGQVISGQLQLTTTPTVTIGGASAKVVYAGLTPGSAGLFQFNVIVPDGLPNGDATLAISSGGVSIQDGIFLSVQN